MIARAAEIRRGLLGALAILKGEADAMARFDLTVDGFFKSFTAIVLAAPGYLVLVLLRLEREPVALAPLLFFLLETLGYVLGWLAFPVAAGVVLYLLRQGSRFVPLVVAANWAAVLQVAFLAAAHLVALALPLELAAPLTTVAVLSALFYQWLVVKTALEAPGGIAVGFVLLDIVVSLMVSGATDRLEAWLAAVPYSSSVE